MQAEGFKLYTYLLNDGRQNIGRYLANMIRAMETYNTSYINENIW